MGCVSECHFSWWVGSGRKTFGNHQYDFGENILLNIGFFPTISPHGTVSQF